MTDTEEKIIKQISTSKGIVKLIKPTNGLPFLRYESGGNEGVDSFKYIIRQFGEQDTATVTINIQKPLDPTDKEELKDELEGIFTHCISKLMGGTPATKALTNILGIDEGPVFNEKSMDIVFDKFDERFTHFDGGRWSVKEHAGTYAYDLEKEDWFYEKDVENIVIKFPSQIPSENADTRLIIERYEYEDFENQLLPKSLKGRLVLDHTEYFNLDIRKIGYRKIGNEYIPFSGDASAFVNPFEFNLTVEYDNLSWLGDFHMHDGSSCGFRFKGQMDVEHDDWDHVDPEQISFHDVILEWNDLKLTGLETLYSTAMTKPKTQEELDKLLNVIIHLRGKEIGQLKFIMGSNEVRAVITEDNSRLNLTHWFEEHFKEYYETPNEDGSPKNDAFVVKESNSFTSAETGELTFMEAVENAYNKGAAGYRRRTANKPIDEQTVAGTISKITAYKNEVEDVPTKEEATKSPEVIKDAEEEVPKEETSKDIGIKETTKEPDAIKEVEEKITTEEAAKDIGIKEATKEPIAIKEVEEKVTNEETTKDLGLKEVTKEPDAVKEVEENVTKDEVSKEIDIKETTKDIGDAGDIKDDSIKPESGDSPKTK